MLGVLLRGGCALTRARARCETCRFGTESLFVAATRYRPFSFNGEIPLRNSPERKMAVSGLADVVATMRKGMVPWVMANGRIVALMRGGQKLVFGDAEEVAWRLMLV